MSGHDCLIWVDGDYKTANQFIKEAQTRGCCRKVAFWPSWAKPGETRVFLAHRGGHRRTDRGSIFGYFTLHGVDIILTQRKCDRYKRLRANFLKAPKDPVNLEALLDFWRKESGGKDLPVTIPPAKRPKTPPPPKDDPLIKFLLDFLISCEPNGDGRGAGGYGISVDQAVLEADRLCGARPGNLSIYFVDSLAREVESIFCELLKKLIKKALGGEDEEEEGEEEDERERHRVRTKLMTALRRKAASRIRHSRRLGVPEFDQAVREAHSRDQARAPDPKKLPDFAHLRGAMVVFEQPYPSFRRLPQAAFRGLLRINGDQLLTDIQDAYKSKDAKESRTLEVPLRYYQPQLPRARKKTQDQLIIDLAYDLQGSKEFAGEVWNSFLGMIERELKETGWITLTNVGSLRCQIDGRGKKQVKFKRSDGLVERVRAAKGPCRAYTGVSAVGRSKP